MDLNDIRSLVTLLSLCLFVALMAWTWWPTRRASADEAAQLPFAGEAAQLPVAGEAGSVRDGAHDE
jgi:cytochrome c oxidase cbb3-type subunit 4